jgi:hypothetical protein
LASHLLGLPVPQKLLAVNWQRSVAVTAIRIRLSPPELAELS